MILQQSLKISPPHAVVCQNISSNQSRLKTLPRLSTLPASTTSACESRTLVTTSGSDGSVSHGRRGLTVVPSSSAWAVPRGRAASAFGLIDSTTCHSRLLSYQKALQLARHHLWLLSLVLASREVNSTPKQRNMAF